MSSYHGWTHAPKEQGGTDPIPMVASAASSVWAYGAWWDGDSVPSIEDNGGLWWDPPAFDEFFISDDGVGVLDTASPSFGFDLIHDGSTHRDDGVWLVHVIPSWVQSFATPGFWVGAGNLIGAAGSLANFDTHQFQPADILTTYAFNQAHVVPAMHQRVQSSTGTNFLAEIFQNTGDPLDIGAVVMRVCKLASVPTNGDLGGVWGP